MLSAQTIQDQQSGVAVLVGEHSARTASVCNLPHEASAESLVFASDLDQLAEARLHKPAILIIHARLTEAALSSANPETACFSVNDMPMAMALLLKYFDEKRIRFSQWGKRHPTAVVHEAAIIGENVYLGPYCVVGSRAIIGEGCLIGAHAVIENGAKIGPRTIIHPQVFVGSGCEVGSDCEIHPHTSIGSDGFGYAVDPDGRSRKISHLGNVKIGDAVEIGSNSAVDRATLSSTYVRSGTKIDNFCHIAHNCDVGENGVLVAGFLMGGSSKVGRQFVAGGASVLTDHVTLGDNVVLAGRSTVTNDITKAGSYGGYPLQPLKDAMKTIATVGHLTEIRRNLNRVMRHLHLSHKAHDQSDA
jgi:UDP-3-O-[3-hydroxymyristoyl] glucosamine N-acyltransferase